MRILIAEDDEDSRVLLQSALESEDYAVECASNGLQALEMARRSPPDMIISDILMPEMDGYSLCEAVKRDAELKHIPFVFYTATFVEPKDEKLALALGASRFIVKPLEVQDFLNTIEEVLNEHKQHRLTIPEHPSGDAISLEQLHTERLLHKLDKKLKELENERVVLEQSEDRYRRLVESTAAVPWELDPTDWRFTYVGPQAIDLLGYPLDTWYEAGFWEEHVHADDREWAASYCREFVERGEHHEFEYRMIAADGRIVWILDSVSVVTNAAGTTTLQGFMFDVTERIAAEEKVRKLSQAVEQSPASIIITDADGIIEYVNPKFTSVTGYHAKEVLGKSPNILKSGRMPDGLYEQMWKSIAAGREWQGELYNRKKNGQLYWEHSSISPIRGHNGSITHYLAVKEDISVRKEYEQRLLRQANYDDLTGLPNRVLALDRLSQSLLRSKREHGMVALLFVDLDQFKNVNDTQGHEAGDRLLIQAAERLRECVRDGDTIARLGGDEFLVILPTVDAVSDAEVVAEKVLIAFSHSFALDGKEFFITASIGITLYPMDGGDPQTLLRNADAAMYQAKESGRNTYRFFTREMNERAVMRLEMESYLRRALERNELSVFFQPLVDLGSGQVIGGESLLRWQSPVLGSVPAEQFVPLAEESGLIVPIGEWVLKTVCQQAKAWQAPGQPPLRVSVNVSSRQFREPNFANFVANCLQEAGLPADYLELEITEHLLLEDIAETHRQLNELGAMGIGLTIDDFGTGYSSLSYLKRFPFDRLKIDRAFVRDVTTDEEDAALASAIIAMAHSLGLKVIGEGVETGEQLQFLRSHGCDMCQGYYFSHPVSFDEFSQVLTNAHDGWLHSG